MGQYVCVAHHQHLSAGTRQSHVELTVYHLPLVVNEGAGGEEVELEKAADTKVVDNHIALRPLIALHRVDADTWHGIADGSNLLAIGDDDAQGLVWIETVAIETTDTQGEIDGVGC